MKTLEVSVFLGALLGIATATGWWDYDIGTADANFNPDYVYRSYVDTPHCTPSKPMVYPASVQELQKIIIQAVIKGEKLKPLGSRHTRNDAICTDGTPIAMDKFNSIRMNSDNTVTAGAGAKMRDVLLFLQANNRSFTMTPKYTGISVGGAIGTGAHGTSLKHYGTVGDHAVSMKVITGLGIIKTVRGHELKEWIVNLGLQGIVVEATLSTVPQFKTRMVRTREPESVLLDGTLAQRARTADSVGLQWFPNQGIVGISESTFVDQSTPGDSFENFFTEATPQGAGGTKFLLDTIQERRGWNAHFALEQMNSYTFDRLVIGSAPVITDDYIHFSNPGVGVSWKMNTGQCFSCYWDIGPNSYYTDDDEIAISLDELPAVVKTIKEIAARERFPLVSVGVAMRFVKTSEAYISFTNGWKETVVLEIITPSRSDLYNTPKYGLAANQAIIQALITKHNGRPHWGKNGFQYLSRSVLLQRVPGRLKFLAAMAKNDPAGVFMNKFGLRLAGLSTHMDIHPNVTHCALQNYCICQKNSDCAEGQVCTTTTDGENSYSVCKDIKVFVDPPLKEYNPQNSTSVIQAVVASLSS